MEINALHYRFIIQFYQVKSSFSWEEPNNSLKRLITFCVLKKPMLNFTPTTFRRAWFVKNQIRLWRVRKFIKEGSSFIFYSSNILPLDVFQTVMRCCSNQYLWAFIWEEELPHSDWVRFFIKKMNRKKSWVSVRTIEFQVHILHFRQENIKYFFAKHFGRTASAPLGHSQAFWKVFDY